MEHWMRLKIIACQIAFREMCHVAARSGNFLSAEFLPYDLHDDPKKATPRLQERVDAVPEDAFDAVLIGFGLCEKILDGLTARALPLVIPRAHDCLTFFLGSKERYLKVFFEDPRTYYYSAGWVEKNELTGGKMAEQRSTAGLMPGYEEYVRKYGEEQAKALMEILEGWKKQYHRALYIAFDFVDHLDWQQKVHGICQQNHWDYAEIPGDLGLLQRWVDGEWDERDFLVVPPGRSVAPTLDGGIIGLAPPPARGPERKRRARRAVR
jgi:hypothetical protein